METLKNLKGKWDEVDTQINALYDQQKQCREAIAGQLDEVLKHRQAMLAAHINRLVEDETRFWEELGFPMRSIQLTDREDSAKMLTGRSVGLSLSGVSCATFTVGKAYWTSKTKD